MARTISPLLPSTQRLLAELGERLRLVRLRRRVSAAHVAERAGMAPKTLTAVERGAPGATVGAYLAVLQVLQLEGSLAQVASDDPLGRALQDRAARSSRARRQSPRSLQAQPTEIAPQRLAQPNRLPEVTTGEEISTDSLLEILRTHPTT